MREWNQTICIHSLVHCVHEKNNIRNLEVPLSEYGNYNFNRISTKSQLCVLGILLQNGVTFLLVMIIEICKRFLVVQYM